MRIVLDHTGRFLLALPALLLVGLLWLLSSQAGSQFVLDRVSAASDGMIDIGQVQAQSHLLGNLRIDRIAVNTPGAQITIEDLALRWSPLALLALRAQVDQLAAGQVTITLRATAEAAEDTSPSAPPPSRLPVNVLIRDMTVAALTVTDVNGQTQALRTIGLRGEWRGDRIRLPRLTAMSDDYGPLALAARGRLSAEQATLDALAVAAPFSLQARGHYAYAGAFAAQLDWAEARWPLVGDPQLRSNAGTARIEGTLEAYQLGLEADLSSPEYEGRFLLDGSGSSAHLHVDRLEVAALDGHAEARGTVQWAPALQLDVEARLKALNLAALLPEWPGRITGELQATGGLDRDNPLRFSARVHDSTLRGFPLKLDAEGGWQGDTLVLERAELHQGSTRLSARGTAWPTLDLKADLDSPDLAALLPQLSGSARLRASARGAPERPALTVDGAADALGWDNTVSIKTLRLTGQLDPDGPVALDLDAGGITGAAAVDALRATLRGEAAQHQLQLDATLPQGALDLMLAGTLDLDALRWRGQLQRANLHAHNVPPLALRAPAELRLSATAQSLQTSCWDSPAPAQVGFCLNGRHQEGEVAARLALERFDYGLIAAFLPERWQLDGAVAGHADLALTAGGTPVLDVDLRTEAGGLDIGRQAAMQFLPGHIRLHEDGGGLQIDIDLPTSQGGIRVDGQVAPADTLAARALAISLQARFDDLAWIDRLSPEFRDLEGALNADVSVGGTVDQPLFEGQVALDVPQIALVTPGITLKDVAARLHARPGEAATVSAQATAGSGQLALEGSVTLDTAAPQLQLHLTGDEAQLADLADARVWASPDITVSLAEQRLDVKGRVDIPRATITPRGFEGGTAPSSDQVIVRTGVDQPDPLMDVYVNVTVALGDKVTFDGFGLKSRLTGDLTARQSPGRAVTGRGEIRLIDGRYKAYGQDLSIETGRLLFTGGPITDPAIEIRATRQPRDDIEVGVSVRGRLDKPEFALFSTPGMPQDQQLSWLILGRDLSTSTTGDDQAALAGAALSLGLSGSDFLAQRLKGGLRIDDISIGARPGEDPEAAKLTIGKYLSPKLYVSYGVGLFQPGHIFRLLYDIGRGFKLQTETGVASGADLLYTIER